MKALCDTTVASTLIVDLLRDVGNGLPVDDGLKILGQCAESVKLARGVMTRTINATAAESATHLDADRISARGKLYARLTWLRLTLPVKRYWALTLVTLRMVPSNGLIAAIQYPVAGGGDEQ